MTNLFDKSSSVTVSYYVKGFLRKEKRITEEFILDYSSYSGSLYTTSGQHKALTTLEKIEKDLGAINKTLNRMS